MESTVGPRERSTALIVAVAVVHGLAGLGLGVVVLAMLGLQGVYGSSGDGDQVRVFVTITAFAVTALSFPVLGWLGVRAFHRGAATPRWVLLLVAPFVVLGVAAAVAATWANLSA